MKYAKRLLAVLAILVVAAWYAHERHLLPTARAAATDQYATIVSATASNSQVSFGFEATQIVVANDDTTNVVWLNFASGTAVAASPSYKLLAGEKISIGEARDVNTPGRTTMGIICTAAQTATVRVLALR